MNDYSAPDASIRVCKRDGGLEPFVLAKLLHCIRCGLQAAGQAHDLDTTTAGSLGEAVYEYLKSTYDGRTVTSGQLAELVELVLTQTGHIAAAMSIREHHRMRERQRHMVMVASARPNDGRIVQQRWNKGHIVQHLRRQHLLDTPASRMIAGRVEQLVFTCGLRVVTCGLIREMAKSELLAWGLLPGALVVKRSKPPREPRKVRDKSDSA
jgi:hypothetical protein